MDRHAAGSQVLRASGPTRLRTRVETSGLQSEHAFQHNTMDASKPLQSSLSSFFTCFASRSTIASVCASVITSELRIALQITIVCASEPVGIEHAM